MLLEDADKTDIPEMAACSGIERGSENRGKSEFGVGVGAYFAVQLNFFVLRGGPFHRDGSNRQRSQRKNNSTRAGAREAERSCIAARSSRLGKNAETQSAWRKAGT
jgi:hypothetical protein